MLDATRLKHRTADTEVPDHDWGVYSPENTKVGDALECFMTEVVVSHNHCAPAAKPASQTPI
eukprot:5429127-Amphidinium_carterae.1